MQTRERTSWQTDKIQNLVRILDECDDSDNIPPELRQRLEYRVRNCDKCRNCINPHFIEFMEIVRTRHSLHDLNALLPINCSSCVTIFSERNSDLLDLQYRPSRSLDITTTVTDCDEEQ